MLPHVAPDGTVWTTTTNNPQQQDFSHADIYLIWSKDGGATWEEASASRGTRELHGDIGSARARSGDDDAAVRGILEGTALELSAGSTVSAGEGELTPPDRPLPHDRSEGEPV